MGNNARSSANIGFNFAYDDRTSLSFNDRASIQVTRGVAGQTAVAQFPDNAHPANVPVIFSHISDPSNGTAANRSFLRINNTLFQTNTSTNAPVASNASFALQIGACGNNAAPLIGYIAEIVVLASIASNKVREEIEGYLAWKWGLRDALIVGHPFANHPRLIGA
jgi:hypothetical protein